MSESRNGTPLEGVRVVEMSSLLAGPFEKVLGLGEEGWDGLRERGTI